MATSSLHHRRTHNLLLISKLLNQRDAPSPFTLILDTLEQSGRPLLAEYVRRANASHVQVIFLSFETLKAPSNIATFIPAWQKNVPEWRKEVATCLAADATQRKLLIIDSLNALAAESAADLPTLLSSLIGPTTSVVATYHIDVPPPHPSQSSADPYSPTPLTLLKYFATTVFTAHSLHHILAQQAARERSHAQPVFGLEKGVDGVFQSLGANGVDGTVLEMEHRRKSGRGVKEWYFLPLRSANAAVSGVSVKSGTRGETVILLEDHPLYRSRDGEGASSAGNAGSGAERASTFELGLTERQRQDRDGVVLPYFDAQQGGGEGGRILYDMGSEDDFDEEEDEI